jgi:hypothetical protein
MTFRVITKKESILAAKLQAHLPAASLRGFTAAAPEEKTGDTSDSYLEALKKYIPVGVLGGYVFLDNVLKAASPPPVGLSWGLFIFLILMAFAFSYYLVEKPEVPAPAGGTGFTDTQMAGLVKEWNDLMADQKIKQALIAAGAFIIYAIGIGGTPFSLLDWWQSIYSSAILVCGSLLLALIVAIGKQETPATQPTGNP